MTSRIRWSILALALLGLALAAASAHVHYRVLTDASYISPCDINSKFSCSQVYLSRFGSVWGVPVALGGLIWFALVGLVAGFARADGKSSVAGSYLFALATIGLAVILYLGYASFFILGTGCILCIGTYVCVLGIFALSASTTSISMTRLPLRLLSDLRSVASRPVTLVVAMLYLVGAASVVAFFPKEGARPPQAPLTGDRAADFAAAWAQQPRVDLGFKTDDAKVVLVKFNDYECPPCGEAERFYQPVLEKFAKSDPGAVKYIFKDWPWNASCNFNVPTTFRGHEASCAAAGAARIAREHGKFEEMKTWLFANQATTPEAVQAATVRIAGITDFAKEYARQLPAIRSDIADGGVLHVSETPTFFLNGVRLSTIQPEYLEMAINIELKK